MWVLPLSEMIDKIGLAQFSDNRSEGTSLVEAWRWSLEPTLPGRGIMKIYKNHAALQPDHDLDPPSTQCHDIHDHVQLSDKRQRMAGPSYAAHDTSYDPYTTNHGTFIIYAIL